MNTPDLVLACSGVESVLENGLAGRVFAVLVFPVPLGEDFGKFAEFAVGIVLQQFFVLLLLFFLGLLDFAVNLADCREAGVIDEFAPLIFGRIVIKQRPVGRLAFQGVQHGFRVV